MSASTKKRGYEPTLAGKFHGERWAILLGLGILALIVLLLYLGYQYRSSQTGPFRNEYEGKIVDKWAKYSESETGSRPGFTFMIEENDGKRFPVAVSSEIYQRGGVGMRIKKTEKGGVQLMDEGAAAGKE